MNETTLLWAWLSGVLVGVVTTAAYTWWQLSTGRRSVRPWPSPKTTKPDFSPPGQGASGGAMEENQYATLMREMCAVSRAEFRRRAAPYLVDADVSTKTFADSLEKAIGEVSPDAALDALRRYRLGERGR